MRRPIQLALTDAASRRMSMPFLPTLAVAILLAAASAFCPSSQPAAPPGAAETSAAAAPGPTAFAEPASAAIPARIPASLAFAEAYPLASAPPASTPVASTPPASTPPASTHLSFPASPSAALRGGPGARAARHLASVARKPCAGRRCAEVPPRAADPLGVARGENAGEAIEDGFLPQIALPFAAVAETLAPAVRVVGAAAGLVRSGAASVRGSVVLLADRLP